MNSNVYVFGLSRSERLRAFGSVTGRGQAGGAGAARGGSAGGVSAVQRAAFTAR